MVIVNFWATWCAPCRSELPAFDAYQQAHGREGLRTIAISLDDARRTNSVATVAKAFHFPVAMGRKAILPSEYRPSMLPMTLVFDRSGVLRFDSRRKPGLFDAARLEQEVGPLLAQPAGH